MTVDTAPAFWDKEAEAAVIAACLRYQDATADALAMGLRPEHFSSGNSDIFSAIVAVAQTDDPVTQVTVAYHLARENKLEFAGGQTALADMIRSSPGTAKDIAFYGQMVRERALVRREYQRAWNYCQSLLEQGADVERVMNHYHEQVLTDATADIRQDGPRSVGEILEGGEFEALEEWMKNPNAIVGPRSGSADLDRMIGGLAPGRIFAIGASTSAGKTQYIQHIARFAAIGGHPTLVLSTEMSYGESIRRWVFQEAGFDRIGATITADKARELRRSVADLAERPIWVWEMGGFDLPRVAATVRRMKARHKIRLVLLDLLNGLDMGAEKGENTAQAIARAMQGIKALAVSEQVHIMFTAHINRMGMQKLEMLGLNDFRDSGAIEQWSDQAMMLMPVDDNGQVVSREAAAASGQSRGYVRVMGNLCKNRHGSLGTVFMRLNWDMGGRWTEDGD